ncbi:MAG TPA: tetratricopeptide repeat protein [Bacteroidota bacterium]|nr:tetratricopeptide repeat protein [Bacteroidota bacterium]
MKALCCFAAGAAVLLAGCARFTEDQLWSKIENARANGNPDSTIQVCQLLLKQYPEGKDAPAALYMIAETYQDGKHDYRNAVNYYHAFVTRYADLNSTPVAMFLIGFIYNNNLQMTDSARMAYEEFIAKFPNHELAASAKFEIDNLGKTPDEIMAIKKAAEEKQDAQSKKTLPKGRWKKR